MIKFEVINDKNKTVMNTTSSCCIPNKYTLSLMSKAGYKFKLDGKTATIKKLCETFKEVNDDKNN